MREALARSSPMKHVRRRRFLSKLVIALIVLGILFAGFGVLSGIPQLVVNEVDVLGTESLQPIEIEQTTLQSISGRQWLFYARANVFLFSKKNIVDAIITGFPRVYQVSSIERDGQKLTISVEERHAAYTWCGHDAPTYSARFERGACYFLDQEGFAFAPAPQFTEGVYLSIYGGMPRESEIIGETINLRNNIADVYQILEILEDNGLRVHSLVLAPDGQHAFLLDISTSTGEYAKILWNEDVPLTETLEKLSAALSEENFQKDFSLHGGALLYVDTRFNNRVFYKFATEI